MLDLLALLLGILHAVLRSHADLVAENLLLRHQLAVVARPGRTRPPLRVPDTLLWIVARRLCPGWRRHLVLVRPETVVRWHRQAWHLFWRWKSRSGLGRPRLSAEARELIAVMSRDESALGQRADPRRAAEAGHRRQQPLDPALSRGAAAPTSEPELAHLPRQPCRAIWAADLFTVQTLTFKTLYVLVFIAHGRRELVHVNVTASPTATAACCASSPRRR